MTVGHRGFLLLNVLVKGDFASLCLARQSRGRLPHSPVMLRLTKLALQEDPLAAFFRRRHASVVPG